MNESASTSVTNLRAHVSRVVLLVSLLVMGLDSPAWGKVLFLVHADGSTAKADFALGATAASPVWPDVYKGAGTVAGGSGPLRRLLRGCGQGGGGGGGVR